MIEKEKHKQTDANESNYNSGHLAVVKSLIENGANVDDKDNFGWTALHRSSYNGN